MDAPKTPGNEEEFSYQNVNEVDACKLLSCQNVSRAKIVYRKTGSLANQQNAFFRNFPPVQPFPFAARKTMNSIFEPVSLLLLSRTPFLRLPVHQEITELPGGPLSNTEKFH